MKRLGLLLAVGGAGVLFYVLVVQPEQEMAAVSNEFLGLVAERRYAEAFALTSDQMHQGTTPERFSRELAGFLGTDMHNYSSANWRDRTREDNRGRLEGKLVFDDGTHNDVTVDLVKEEGRWRIASFDIE